MLKPFVARCVISSEEAMSGFCGLIIPAISIHRAQLNYDRRSRGYAAARCRKNTELSLGCNPDTLRSEQPHASEFLQAIVHFLLKNRIIFHVLYQCKSKEKQNGKDKCMRYFKGSEI